MNWAELSHTIPNTPTHYAAIRQDVEEETKMHDLYFTHKAWNKLPASCQVLGAMQEKTRRYSKEPTMEATIGRWLALIWEFHNASDSRPFRKFLYLEANGCLRNAPKRHNTEEND
jgi:hypothetical protein